MSKKAWNRHRRIIFVTKKDDKRIIGEFFSGKRKKKKDSVNCIQILWLKGLMQFSLIGKKHYRSFSPFNLFSIVPQELENEKIEGIFNSVFQ